MIEDIAELRIVAQRLCDAIADRVGAEVREASGRGSVGDIYAAEDEELAALKALRAALDGRSR